MNNGAGRTAGPWRTGCTQNGKRFYGCLTGKMTASGGGNYEGEITKPDTGKTYTGKAKLSGSSLKLSGCVFGGLICESQVWTRL